MHKHVLSFKFIVFLFVFFFFSLWMSRGQSHTVLPPRFSANAYTGVYTVGQADLMVSLDGDQQHNLYVNPQGAYGSDQQWYGDLGLGYRWIKNDAAILGWYLFAGRTRVANTSSFWITNPGVEVIGSRWDARINAYIPAAGRSNALGIEEFNIVSEPFFTGHTEVINSVFNNENAIQQIGNGADARVGYQFFQRVPLKGYVGAYFFNIHNTDNVRGGAAGMEYWLDDTIRVFANYSYDNYQHSKVVGGLGISFGGVRKHWADPSLSERLTDPVERYLANLGHGSGIPSQTLLYGMGSGSSTQLISTDIAFFSQTGTPNAGGVGLTLANCTFENPCGPTDFSQTGVNTLNGLLPNTLLFFNGGTYPASNGTNPLTLNNGQGVFSRTADYSAAASGAARSTFNGAFILNGNNQLNGVILNNTLGVSTNAISSNGGQNIMISNSQIGNAGTPYSDGLNLTSSTVTLASSTVFADAAGIFASGSSSLIMQSSVINTSTPINTDGQGIVLNGASKAEINNSQINVTGNFVNIGISTTDTSSAIVNNSDITVTGIGSTSFQIGLEAIEGAITMNGGTVSVNSSGPTSINLGNVQFENLVVCTINGMTVDCATS
jgi:hypothetical protein